MRISHVGCEIWVVHPPILYSLSRGTGSAGPSSQWNAIHFVEGEEMKITYSQLKALGAFSEQLSIFRAIFGEEADLNPENLGKAVGVDFNFEWLARKTLHAPALAEYDYAEAIALAE